MNVREPKVRNVARSMPMSVAETYGYRFPGVPEETRAADPLVTIWVTEVYFADRWVPTPAVDPVVLDGANAKNACQHVIEPHRSVGLPPEIERELRGLPIAA